MIRNTIRAALAGLALLPILALGTVSAAEPTTSLPPQAPPGTAVWARGTVHESDGDSVRLNFHANNQAGVVNGNLNFQSEDGSYNGGVRYFAVQGGVIYATGAGPMTLPDGRRLRVNYSATFGIESKRVSIHVSGADGYSYTVEGTLDGVVGTGRTLPAVQ